PLGSNALRHDGNEPRASIVYVARRAPHRRSIHMSITRKQFLGSISGGTVTLLIQACGGGGSSGGGATTLGGGAYGGMGPAGCGSSGAQIAGNHGHVLTVPIFFNDTATTKTYSIMGAAT